MSEMNRAIGERLKRSREKANLKQNAVAKWLGIHNSTLAKYESGEREVDNKTLVTLCEKYDVRLEWVMTGEGEIRSSSSVHEEPTRYVPDFATSRDKRDFKDFLQQQEVMFDGVPMSDEDKARVIGYMEGMFWEAKQMNKRKKKDVDDKQE